MALIGLKNVHVQFDGPPLLDGVDLQIERGERIGLVGRNGAGKTTLLRVLAGEQRVDDGDVARTQGLRVATLEQVVPRGVKGTVEDVVRAAVRDVGEATWRADEALDRVLRSLELDRAHLVETLSAGLRRRVALASALVADPDLLILDEPTNHLDVDAILRLEELLERFTGALVFVTHDRAFLRRRALRILDLDRGRLGSYDCDYTTYLDRREAELEAEVDARAQFDKKLAKEEAWIRRGVKARRRRNQGRVRALLEMREERRLRRDRQGAVSAAMQEASSSGQLVLRAQRIGHDFGAAPVFSGLDLEVYRGDRIGIVGKNGSGKTTLLRALLGELEPKHGSIVRGTNVTVARLEQIHVDIDLSLTAKQIVAADADHVFIDGKPRHVISYLEDFLFTPEQARSPVRKLSGGERHRLQLAALLARPCNLLVLDEPTNDLDVETLEILEQWLMDFSGTVLLVSHDREFLDNVVTSTLVFEGNGRVAEYAGGYSDWLRQRPSESTRPIAPKMVVAPPKKEERPPRRKLSNKERAELASLPLRIEGLEAEKDSLSTQMSDPSFYRRNKDAIATDAARMAAIDRDLESAYKRWSELEEA